MRRFSFSLFCDDLYRGIGCTGPVLNDGPGAQLPVVARTRNR